MGGLASQNVQPETTLTFSHPHCAQGETKAQKSSQPKVCHHQGNVAAVLAGSQAWEVAVPRSRWLFVLIFFF